MNILFSGDRNIEDGLLLSSLSLAKNTTEPLKIYVLSAEIDGVCQKIRPDFIEIIRKELKNADKRHDIKLIDISKEVLQEFPSKNQGTFFTVGCMFRLYADLVKELPDKILYLDTDVLSFRDFKELYDTDIKNVELAGVLDNYGSHFFHQGFSLKRTYLNSGVLLLNLQKICETKLFERARKYCLENKMFMPDQSALNKLLESKIILPRKYNEQKEMKKDTVLRHFTTRVRFIPYVHRQTVKPWNTEEMHSILKCHEFDDILDRYKVLKREVK